ncbi:LysR family transcriptional regulator [Moritella sp. F3]|uniref:LysR family transcriptional regulator n=1 Tax=Moritella sp. F3 TaxID=2718882 RepID=UPI0018E1B70D|nr:LysR family transcriptional regulator [Moritella sp. F3]GIC76972.1 LysR family transcriptional regulator [Moritella sp. F1]GIC80155.1 LysR family transcriptional regulator [Moritella sp. F3]
MKTEDIALFHRIVEAGSLVDAAGLLYLPKSTISRRLQGLEDDLGVKLFHRQNRAMTLTTAGSHFYDKTLSLLASLEQTITDITDKHAEISGHLRILLFPVPDLMLIVNGIYQFMDLNPKLTVELIVNAEPLDMIRHNIDIAFMVDEAFNNIDIDMVARPVLSEILHFVASPEYLDKAGTPAKLSDISQHNSIMFRFPNGQVFNELPLGNNKFLSVSGNICLNSVQLALESTLANRGIAYIPERLCEEYIKAGKLIRLFADVQPYEGKCYLTYPSRRFVSLASQRLIDHMLNFMTSDDLPICTKSREGKAWY